MRVGVGLLVIASLSLIGGGAYAYYAVGHPKDITFYRAYTLIEPGISIPEIIGFVVLEHLLVACGVLSLVRDVRRRSRATGNTA